MQCELDPDIVIAGLDKNKRQLRLSVMHLNYFFTSELGFRSFFQVRSPLNFYPWIYRSFCRFSGLLIAQSLSK